jgi:hypothetical protein
VQDSFVVGLASLESRVGLFSFARYDPAFSDRFQAEGTEEDSDEEEEAKQKKRRTKAKTAKKGKKEQSEDEKARVEDAAKAEANRKILIARSCKVMAHEVRLHSVLPWCSQDLKNGISWRCRCSTCSTSSTACTTAAA